MPSCNTCADGFMQENANHDHCIGCADCNKWTPSDSFKISEYDRLKEIEDKYDAIEEPKRFIAITQEYVNCPSCEGADGFAEIHTFYELQDIIELILETGRDQEVTKTYDIAKDTEAPISIRVDKGNHCVQCIRVSFGEEGNKIVRGPWCIVPKTKNSEGRVEDKDSTQLDKEDRRMWLKLI